MRGVEADSCVASHYPQQSLIMHIVEQVRGGIRRSSPIVADLAVGKVGVHFARMHDAALTHELKQ